MLQFPSATQNTFSYSKIKTEKDWGIHYEQVFRTEAVRRLQERDVNFLIHSDKQ